MRRFRTYPGGYHGLVESFTLHILVPKRAEIWTQICEHEYKSIVDGCSRAPSWLRDWVKGAYSEPRDGLKNLRRGILVEQVLLGGILSCSVFFCEGQSNAVPGHTLEYSLGAGFQNPSTM